LNTTSGVVEFEGLSQANKYKIIQAVLSNYDWPEQVKTFDATAQPAGSIEVGA
jgi:hypothetical protein